MTQILPTNPAAGQPDGSDTLDAFRALIAAGPAPWRFDGPRPVLDPELPGVAEADRAKVRALAAGFGQGPPSDPEQRRLCEAAKAEFRAMVAEITRAQDDADEAA